MVYLAAVGLVGRSLVMLGGSHLRKGGSHCYNAAPYIVNLGETRSSSSWAGFWNHVTWSSLIDKSIYKFPYGQNICVSSFWTLLILDAKGLGVFIKI